MTRILLMLYVVLLAAPTFAEINWEAEYKEYLQKNSAVAKAVESGKISKEKVLAGIKARRAENGPSEVDDTDSEVEAREWLEWAKNASLEERRAAWDSDKFRNLSPEVQGAIREGIDD